MPETPPSSPTSAHPVQRFFKTWANPKYHVAKMREDLAAARHGLQLWHLSQLKDDPESFEKGARGKMFATFVMAGAFSAIALPIGIAAQSITNNAYVGLITPILVGHGISNIAFQIIWAWTNRDLYAQNRGIFSKFMSVQRDILPMQWAGIKATVPLLAAALPINGFFAFILQQFFPNAVRYVPIGFIMVAIEMLFFNGTFIRIMGNQFEKYAKVMRDRYCRAK